MSKTLPILILASLATVASPYSLADDSSYGVSSPDTQAIPDPDLTPGASTSTYPYQPMQQRDNWNPAISAYPSRQVGPNAPAHPEDYAP